MLRYPLRNLGQGMPARKAPADGSREGLIAALVRQARRYHDATLQDRNLMIAVLHNAYAFGIIGTLNEEVTEEEAQRASGVSLKDLRDEIYVLQRNLEEKVFELDSGIIQEIKAESPWLGQIPLEVPPAQGGREGLIAGLIRQAQRYHYSSLQDMNLIVAGRHNAYVTGIIGSLSELATEDEVQKASGISLKEFRDEIYALQDKLEKKAFDLARDMKVDIKGKSPWLGEEKNIFRNGLWLGQVRLVARPGMGTTVPQEDAWKYGLPKQPKEAKAPRVGCLFLGISRPAAPESEPMTVDPANGWLTYSAANQSPEALAGNIEEAKRWGYDIVSVDAPDVMCPVVDPNRDPNVPTKLNEVPATAPCYEAGSKFVWACPRGAPPEPSPRQDPQAQPAQTLPPAPAPDLVPVAAGAGVVALLAAVIGGAFGK